MTVTTINNIEHRTVDAQTCDWLDGMMDKYLKGNEWYNTAHKAVDWLRKHPVKCEVNPDGTYMVVIASEKNDPGREYVATVDSCECPAHHGKHKRCYHRMVARLLEMADRYETRRAAFRAEQARRVVTAVAGADGSVRYVARYDGQFVGLTETMEEGLELIQAWLDQRAWVESAQAA